jgi:hypothetical protein
MTDLDRQCERNVDFVVGQHSSLVIIFVADRARPSTMAPPPETDTKPGRKNNNKEKSKKSKSKEHKKMRKAVVSESMRELLDVQEELAIALTRPVEEAERRCLNKSMAFVHKSMAYVSSYLDLTKEADHKSMAYVSSFLDNEADHAVEGGVVPMRRALHLEHGRAKSAAPY